MGHLKGQMNYSINLIFLKTKKIKKIKRISLAILGGTLGKQRVQCMHWLLSFQERWDVNVDHLFKPPLGRKKRGRYRKKIAKKNLKNFFFLKKEEEEEDISIGLSWEFN